MTATTIRVRVNPTASGEYVIYADPADTDGQHWLLLGPDGQYDRWEYDEYVADWTEFELRIPPLDRQPADPARRLPGGPVAANAPRRDAQSPTAGGRPAVLVASGDRSRAEAVAGLGNRGGRRACR